MTDFKERVPVSPYDLLELTQRRISQLRAVERRRFSDAEGIRNAAMRASRILFIVDEADGGSHSWTACYGLIPLVLTTDCGSDGAATPVSRTVPLQFDLRNDNVAPPWVFELFAVDQNQLRRELGLPPAPNHLATPEELGISLPSPQSQQPS